MAGREGVELASPLLARVTELARNARSTPGVLGRIVTAMAEHGYPGAGITLINERHELYVVAYDGPPDQDILGIRLPVGEGIMGRVAADGGSVLIEDIDAPEIPEASNRNVGSQSRLRSLLAVPIISDGEVLGVLEIDSPHPGRFDTADEAVFAQIAARIAGAVAEAAPVELAGELLRRRVREVLVLEQTTRALAAELEPEAVQVALVQSIASGLGSPQVVLLELRDGVARVVAAHGDPPVAVDGAEVFAGDDRLTATPHALSFMPVETVEAGLGLAAGSLEDTIVALLPVQAGDEFSGAVLVASRDQRGFDPAELSLLEGIADLGALAISSAIRYHRLAESADTDATTGLYHRGRFERELAAAASGPLAVLAIDLDRLKQVNDVYGHEAGDTVLQQVGRTLDELRPPDALVARTGADEFAVLLPNADAVEAAAVAEDMRAAMYGVMVPFGVARISIGVAAADVGADPRATWSAADSALERAKRRGRNRVEYASLDVDAASAASSWDEVVLEILGTHAVESVYQPIVRLGNLHTDAYEALARPSGASADLSVEALFTAAHRTGHSRDLDWIARRAAVVGAHSLTPGVPLFINCGLSALLDPVHDVDQMLLLLRWAGREPADVVIEITEREVVDDLGRFKEVLGAYRAEGFRFAIDDVGEGHSTLEVLAAGAPEYVKIARSLAVASHEVGPRAAIRAVVAFARSSGAAIIAEGIETEEHAERLEAFGVDFGQGWWLGRPARLSGAA